MKLLYKYSNGNTQVVLFEDGTKERTYLKNNLSLVHPESIDVKITNQCEGIGGCATWCHEQSNPQGLHGDLNKLKEILKDLPAGVELAIGGGNPLSHPDLISFLSWMKPRGLIANITINQKHIKEYQVLIQKLITENLVKGVGISYSSSLYLNEIKSILALTNNIVFHLIMGLNKVSDIDELNQFCLSQNKQCKVLVLGYKQYGMGIDFYLKNKKIDDNKYIWYTRLAKYFKEENLILSFDNLAINQLKLKRYFTDKAWEEFYMGDDFVYTMYIDAVKQHYASSSTSCSRTEFKDYSLLDFFQKYRKSN